MRMYATPMGSTHVPQQSWWESSRCHSGSSVVNLLRADVRQDFVRFQDEPFGLQSGFEVQLFILGGLFQPGDDGANILQTSVFRFHFVPSLDSLSALRA